MYYANCEWYVDMGEHNKPLCERKGLRPAKCSECPVYIGSIEAENARLRNAVEYLYGFAKTLGVSGDDLREEFGIEVY